MGAGSLALGPHTVEDHSQEARAAPVEEQFLLFLKDSTQNKVGEFVWDFKSPE